MRQEKETKIPSRPNESQCSWMNYRIDKTRQRKIYEHQQIYEAAYEEKGNMKCSSHKPRNVLVLIEQHNLHEDLEATVRSEEQRAARK